MNTYLEIISGLAGHGEASKIFAIVLLALSIFSFAFGCLWILLHRFNPLKQRLNKLVATDDSSQTNLTRLTEQLDSFSKLFVPSNSGQKKTTLDRLNHAGYRSPNALAVFYFVRSMAIAILPIAVFLIHPIFPKIETNTLYALITISGVIGMISPSYYLDRKIAEHQLLLRNGLPDAIDLLVVCTEAGLGLNAALMRVSTVIIDSHPFLAEELFITTTEIRAGVERSQAMMNLAKRTGLEDIKGLVAVLAQSMRFGTSISQTLRVYAEEFRDKRMQKADEEAATVSTKMIFPLIFCILPGFFIVAVGPAIIKLSAVFSKI